MIKSGKRDSNSRPQPWQGCALPTELFPQLFNKAFLQMRCKGTTIFQNHKLFLYFFSFTIKK